MQRTTRTLALVTAVVIVACEGDQGISSPEELPVLAVTAAASTAQIEMTGAAYTDPAGGTLPVNIKTESGSELVLQKNALRTGLAYTNVSHCTGNLALSSYLVSDPADRVFSFKYDKSGKATNPGHYLYLTRLDPLVNVRVRLQSGWAGLGDLPDVAVEVTQLSPATTRYVFRNGAVKVEYLPAKPSKGSEMVCHNHSDIVVELTR